MTPRKALATAILALSASAVLFNARAAETDPQDPGTHSARLTLTDQERSIIFVKVRMRGGSTLGLASLSEGSSVPHGVTLANFPQAVLRQVPKLAAYRYFTLEDVIAVVDPSTMHVIAVLTR
jgi:hypothetical protein